MYLLFNTWENELNKKVVPGTQINGAVQQKIGEKRQKQ